MVSLKLVSLGLLAVCTLLAILFLSFLAFFIHFVNFLLYISSTGGLFLTVEITPVSVAQPVSPFTLFTSENITDHDVFAYVVTYVTEHRSELEFIPGTQSLSVAFRCTDHPPFQELSESPSETAAELIYSLLISTTVYDGHSYTQERGFVFNDEWYGGWFLTFAD